MDNLKNSRKTFRNIIKSRQTKELFNAKEFLAFVAHELRNPLSVALLAVHNMRGKNRGPSLEKSLNVIESKIMECAGIIDDLLVYSKDKLPLNK